MEVFGTRHDTNFRLLSGERAAVGMGAADGGKSKLQNVSREYLPEISYSRRNILIFLTEIQNLGAERGQA
jgi:hypothetical protein